MKSTDCITLQVIAERLNTIVGEMTVTLTRTARSPIANETRDFSVAIVDAGGTLVAQSVGCPILRGAMKWSVEGILKDFRHDLHDGDMILNNDPYCGGAHMGDMTLAMPIFYKNRLVLFPAARSHQVDAGGGGVKPGGFNPEARNCFEESLRIPPLRICERGQMKWDIYDWVIRNSRFKEWFQGDIDAMIASCRIAERRIHQLLDEFGPETVVEALEYALDYSERRVRSEIEGWPDGTYEASSYLDGDGYYNFDIHFHATVTIQGSDLKVDFNGSSPQVRGFANSPLGNTWSWTFIALCGVLDPEIPKNEGIFRPVSLIAPEGSVVNPREGAATGFCTIHPGAEIAEVVTLALSKAIPNRVGTMWDKKVEPVISGIDPRTGKPYLSLNFVMMNGGDGAAFCHDGWGGLCITRGGMAYTTVEMSEVQYPHFIEEREFIQDSCGPGRWRGGPGVKTVERMIDHEASAALMVWGGKYPSSGLCGGKHGSPNRCILQRETGDVEVPPGRCLESQVIPGDRICIFKGGGGGWGDPYSRPPDLVAADVSDGYTSIQAAERDYGVVLDPRDLSVDEKKTVQLRESRQADGNGPKGGSS